MGRDVTGAAGDADAIRPNEFVIVVVPWIAHESIAIPVLARFGVELRVGKKTKPKHARGLAIDFLINPGRLRNDLLVQPQAKFVRLGRGLETGLVNETKSFESLAAFVFAVIKRLENI